MSDDKPFAYQLDKSPSSTHKRLVQWLEENVGSLDDLPALKIAQLVSVNYQRFQASDLNKEGREADRAAKKAKKSKKSKTEDQPTEEPAGEEESKPEPKPRPRKRSPRKRKAAEASS